MKERKGISGSTLKIIAIITMLIDHIGAGVLGRLLVVRGMNEAADLNAWIDANSTLVITYQMMRFVGRLAFPIFCFLLIEGFEHTHDVKKYALRLLSFCLVSEIPFDLLFNGKILESGYQNVFFTLFIGLMLCGDSRQWRIRNGLRSLRKLFLMREFLQQESLRQNF